VSAPSWTIERWLDEAEAASIEYASYWNDVEAERDKPWNVADGDFAKLEQYLAEVGLPADLQACLAALGRPLGERGIDLAAGTLWAAPALLAAGPVQRLYCLEFSRHRLLELGPRMLEHYGVAPERVVLAYGSFYDLRLDDDELDFAFLSQAFHHADRPGALLAELRRVLRPGGAAIIVGEHVIRPRDYAVFGARSLASLAPRRVQSRLFAEPVAVRRTLRPRARDLLPTDPVLGDHAYDQSDYARLFAEAGFSSCRVRRRHGHYQGFVLT
jgi:ubiquinone/menaquinone biosynthesis C-methylase UbiE